MPRIAYTCNMEQQTDSNKVLSSSKHNNNWCCEDLLNHNLSYQIFTKNTIHRMSFFAEYTIRQITIHRIVEWDFLSNSQFVKSRNKWSLFAEWHFLSNLKLSIDIAIIYFPRICSSISFSHYDIFNFCRLKVFSNRLSFVCLSFQYVMYKPQP